MTTSTKTRITGADIRAMFTDVTLRDVPTPQLLQMSTALMSCRSAADAEASEEIARLSGRINGVLKARTVEPCAHDTVELDGDIWSCEDCGRQGKIQRREP